MRRTNLHHHQQKEPARPPEVRRVPLLQGTRRERRPESMASRAIGRLLWSGAAQRVTQAGAVQQEASALSGLSFASRSLLGASRLDSRLVHDSSHRTQAAWAQPLELPNNAGTWNVCYSLVPLCARSHACPPQK